MVFVSKEPELFGGRIRIAVLIDGEEVRHAHCMPEKANAVAMAQVEETIVSFTQYLVKQAPNTRHADIIQFRKLFNNSLVSYEVAGNNIALLRKHLPGGRLKYACQNKLRQIEELVGYRKKMEASTQATRP